MAQEVTKVVEGVDRLFSEIVVNGTTVKSAPTRPRAQSSAPSQQSGAPIQGDWLGYIQLNDIIHNLKDVALTQEVAQHVLALQQAINGLQQALNAITAKIPPTASSTNQLADKNYVNTSISTNTANFLGTYSTLTEIEAIPDPTNNDYAYLQIQTASQLEYDRYKYNSDEVEWLFEYSLIFPIGSGAGVAFIGTRAGYETAKLIPEGEEGHIPSGALVIITDEDDYLNSEDR